LEDLFNPPGYAMNFRSARGLEGEGLVKRGKLLHLQSVPEPLALLVGVKPADDRHSTNELDVWVEVCPLDHHTYLPMELQMAVLNEAGDAVMQATAMDSNEALRFNFTGEYGEQFWVKVAVGSISTVESFQI
jgi:hypothetical protein